MIAGNALDDDSEKILRGKVEKDTYGRVIQQVIRLGPSEKLSYMMKFG